MKRTNDNNFSVPPYDPGYMSSRPADFIPPDTRILIFSGTFSIHDNFYFYSQQSSLAAAGFNTLITALSPESSETITKLSRNRDDLIRYLNGELELFDPIGSGEIFMNAVRYGQKIIGIGQNTNKSFEQTAEEIGCINPRNPYGTGAYTDRIRELMINRPDIKPVLLGVPNVYMYSRYDKNGKLEFASIQSLFAASGIKPFSVASETKQNDFNANRETLCLREKTTTAHDVPDLTVMFPAVSHKIPVSAVPGSRGHIAFSEKEWRDLSYRFGPKP